MLKKLLALACFSLSISANATVIVETWIAEVQALSNNNVNSVSSSTSFNGYSVGDIITWQVTYDSDSGDHYTIYFDGADGKSDRGGNDDTLAYLTCLDVSFDPNCSLADATYVAMYDSNTDASGIYSKMVDFLASDESVYDYFGINNDNRIFRNLPDPDFTQHDYYADEFHMYADNRSDIPGGTGYAQLFYEKPSGEVWESRVGFGNVSKSTTVVPIPIPATAWLFASALLGLGVVKRRKP